MLLQDKVVVVAGIGPGLGRSIAIRSAEQGADVVLAARTHSRLDEVGSEIKALGRRALAVPTDITDPSAAERLMQATLAEFGRADALVLNALAMPPIKDLLVVDLDAMNFAFQTNVIAALRLVRLFAPALVESS
jgi:NADP-dependent 3-hydroxy acid dehydrogenase YdfG